MKKPVLVLISGWAHVPSALRGLGRELSDSFKVVLTSTNTLWIQDETGSGYCGGLVALLQSLDAESVVAGWSTGGMAALEVAVRHSGLMRALVLIGSCARFSAGPGNTDGVSRARLRAMARGLERDPAATLARFFEMTADPFIEKSLEEKVSAACAMNAVELRSGLEYLARFDITRELESVEVPALVAHGRADRIVPWQAADFTASYLKDSRFVLDEEAGHSLPVHRPGVLARRIKEFAG